MSSIDTRLKQVRTILDLTRKDVEKETGGSINQSSLANYETGSSQLSIPYLLKIYHYYSDKISLDLNWLLTGIGKEPFKNSELKIDIVNEITSYKENNINSLVICSSKDIPPLIKVGDFIGATPSSKTSDHSLWIIQKKNGDIEIETGHVINDIFVFTANDDISSINMDDISKLLKVDFIRKQ